MNFFSNSILNILLLYFFRVADSSILTILYLTICAEQIVGIVKTYKLLRGKMKCPVIYCIPFVRELAILFGKYKSKKSNGLRLLGLVFLITGYVLTYCVEFTSQNTAYVFLILIVFLLASICFALLNARFMVTKSKIGKKYNTYLTAVLLYFFPLLTLHVFEQIDEENKKIKRSKKKKRMATVAKALVVIIMTEFILSANSQVYAQGMNNSTIDITFNQITDENIVTGCDICDSKAEELGFPVFIITNDYANVDSYLGITCSDCEIIHLVESNNTLPDTDYFNGIRSYAFFDLSKTKFSHGNNYDGYTFMYNSDYHCIEIIDVDNDLSNYGYLTNQELYLSGVTNVVHYDQTTAIRNKAENSETYLFDNNYYQYVSYGYNGASMDYEISSDAIKLYPKNKGFVPNSNVNSNTIEVTDDTREVIDLQIDNATNNYVDNFESGDYTSVKQYDNEVHAENIIRNCLVDSFAAIAVSGTAALAVAAFGSTVGTVLAAVGLTLSFIWIAEKAYQVFHIMFGKYECEEARQEAKARFIEETIGELCGIVVGGAAYKAFGNLYNKMGITNANVAKEVSNPKLSKEIAKSLAEQNAKIPKLSPNSNLECADEAFQLVEYLKTHNGELPDKYITKDVAINQYGWKNSKPISKFAPGKSIGGDIFNNNVDELPVLPTVNGVIYKEADIGYISGKRNSLRVVYSNYGDYYYTVDHYLTVYRIE